MGTARVCPPTIQPLGHEITCVADSENWGSCVETIKGAHAADDF